MLPPYSYTDVWNFAALPVEVTLHISNVTICMDLSYILFRNHDGAQFINLIFLSGTISVCKT